MDMLKNKRIVTYISLILPVLAIIIAIVGGATKGLVRDTFSATIIVMLIIGALVSIAGFLFEKFDLDALAIIFYGLALGLIFKDGVEVLTYETIGIDNNVGGKGSLVYAYLILGGILFVFSIVNALFNHRKKA